MITWQPTSICVVLRKNFDKNDIIFSISISNFDSFPLSIITVIINLLMKVWTLKCIQLGNLKFAIIIQSFIFEIFSFSASFNYIIFYWWTINCFALSFISYSTQWILKFKVFSSFFLCWIVFLLIFLGKKGRRRSGWWELNSKCR